MKQLGLIVFVYIIGSFATKEFNPWYWNSEHVGVFGIIAVTILVIPIIWKATKD